MHPVARTPLITMTIRGLVLLYFQVFAVWLPFGAPLIPRLPFPPFRIYRYIYFYVYIYYGRVSCVNQSDGLIGRGEKYDWLILIVGVSVACCVTAVGPLQTAHRRRHRDDKGSAEADGGRHGSSAPPHHIEGPATAPEVCGAS